MENIIAVQLEDLNFSYENHHTHGCDFLIENKIRMEVKSCKYLVKNGSRGVRKGNFTIYQKELERGDLFAFIIRYYESVKIEYVEKKELIAYFEEHKKTEKLSLTIPSFRNKIKKIRNIKNYLEKKIL